MSDCIFCRIVRDEVPARIVYQDEDVTAFHDLDTSAPDHILLLPDRHVAGVAEAEPKEEEVLGKLFVVARRLAE